MSYDFESEDDRSPPNIGNNISYRADDLEYIVLLMKLAGIYLTNSPEDEFTFNQLFEQMQSLAKLEKFILNKNDVKIVFDNYPKFKKIFNVVESDMGIKGNI